LDEMIISVKGTGFFSVWFLDRAALVEWKVVPLFFFLYKRQRQPYSPAGKTYVAVAPAGLLKMEAQYKRSKWKHLKEQKL